MIATGLKAIDFFCGGGGMSLGMQKAGINVIAGIDNDLKCRETYEANHPHSKFIEVDITQFGVEELACRTDIAKDDDSLVFIGCSPCQYWSIITGHRDSERKQSAYGSRNLLGDFLQFVQYYRPGFIVIENVRGIDKYPDESGLAELCAFLDTANYCYKKGVLLTNHYGVPQSRKRFILMATRVLDSITFPNPQTTRPTVFDCIGGKNRLAEINAGECNGEDKLHRCAGLSETNIKRLMLTPEGGLRSHWQHRDDLQINAYRNKPASLFPRNYGRMAWNKPAPTITTYFHSISSGRFGHPEETRAISLREGALLQTFPMSYQFKTLGLSDTARVIGNAVPPKFAQSIGEAIVQQWQHGV